jgi:hypothetical protein
MFRRGKHGNVLDASVIGLAGAVLRLAAGRIPRIGVFAVGHENSPGVLEKGIKKPPGF